MQNLPILAITLGDPASIGPEISIAALCTSAVRSVCRPLLIGDLAVMARAESVMRSGAALHAVHAVDEAAFADGVIDIYDVGAVADELPPWGEVSAAGGEAAFRYVEKAIALAMAGEVHATVTNALSKEAIHLAGHHFSGHTEIYAALTGTKAYGMMLAHGDFRVVHVSTHVSLREACDRVKKARVLEVIRMADAACRDMGIDSPRIAVAGLNPHCGEGGLFGREEIDEIIPAIEAAQAEGIDAIGPIPPDTVFSKAIGGWYDVVVVMYHDQGHIPIKVQGFVYDRVKQAWRAVAGVNITLGLPIIRVSVDHGTAFDHAGKGDANAGSLISAIEYAARFASQKMKNE